jgi:hypothetical protein
MAPRVGFFEYTYIMMRPRLIIALGKGPAAFLSHVWPKELSPWRGYTLQKLDELPIASVSLQSHAAICTAITHPSMPNAWHRQPPYQHSSGQIRLLSEARLESERISKA